MLFPVFPLNGAILFPGTNLPLNIFEKRYIEMVDYAMSKNRLIGMIQTNKNGDFFKVGCLGKIKNFSETGDGRYQINLEGLSRYKFVKIINKNYNFKIIEGKEIQTKTISKLNEKSTTTNLMQVFKKFLNLKNIDFDFSYLDELSTFDLAKIITVISPFDYLDKQMLLEFKSEDDLFEKVLSVLEIETRNKKANITIN